MRSELAANSAGVERLRRMVMVGEIENEGRYPELYSSCIGIIGISRVQIRNLRRESNAI